MKIDQEFKGKYAVLTGATSGIGAKTAVLMAKRGLTGIVLVGRNRNRAQEVADQCRKFGCTAYISLCDIANPAEIEKTVAYAVQVLPHIDILINNAGVSPYDDPWDKETVDHWDFILNTNLRSQFLFCQGILREMRKNHYGKIVNVSSVVARFGSGLSASYGASKAGVLGLTRSLAKVVGPEGINVNAVLPGVIDTPMLGGHDYSAAMAGYPMRRLGQPEDIAEAVLFLASDRSSYMCGVSMDVNGGTTMN